MLTPARRVVSAHALLSIALACGCAAGPKAPPVLQNRAASPADGSTAAAPPVGPVHLWCAEPGGDMCGRASRALHVSHASAAALPPSLFESTWRDLDDDCDDPDLALMLDVLGAAVGVPADGWVDQTGSTTVERLEIVVHGGGCTNLTQEGVPDVKVQLTEMDTGMVALVRVWELGPTP